MGKPKLTRSTRIRPLDMSWIDDASCTSVDPDTFVVDKGLKEWQFPLLALCRFRCTVQKQCKSFHVTMARSCGNIIAGGLVFGQPTKPYWRNLTPTEEKEFDEWASQTGQNSALW